MIKVERRSRQAQVAVAVLSRSVKLVALVVGVPVAILTQARLSVFAASGEGVATVHAQAWPVALSVLSAALAALGLLWPAWHLPRIRVRSWLLQVAILPARLPRLCSVRSLADALTERLQVLLNKRWTARERGKVLALWGALAASYIADIETPTEALRPQATAWWIGSVALLLLSALLARQPALLWIRAVSWSFVCDAVLLPCSLRCRWHCDYQT